jgi:hypothetical protein
VDRFREVSRTDGARPFTKFCSLSREELMQVSELK